MIEVYKSHDLEFHKQYFISIRGLYLYRKWHLNITALVWIKKQPFVGKYGLTESRAVILIHLN